MSGSYEVFKAACSQAGAVLVEEIDEFYDAIRAFSLLWKKRVRGNRVVMLDRRRRITLGPCLEVSTKVYEGQNHGRGMEMGGVDTRAEQAHHPSQERRRHTH